MTAADRRPALVPAVLREMDGTAAAQAARCAFRHPATAPAPRRVLPPPFRHFLTIASDCDSTDMTGVLGTAGLLRGRYGLPIADSFFPKWLYRRGMGGAGGNDGGFDLSRFAAANFDWLAAFHAGAFDCVHGWIPRMRIAIAPDVDLHLPPWLIRVAKRWLRADAPALVVKYLDREVRRRRTRVLRFESPATWHQREAPRWLSFRARLPLTNSAFRLGLRRADGSVATIESPDLTACWLGRSEYLVDLQAALGARPEALPEVTVELLGDFDGSLTLEAPTLLSDTRADIARHAAALEALDVRVTTYTSHGGGYDLGRRTAATPAAADPRVLAELPANPQYALDLLRDYGIEFLNTANNISDTLAPHIAELVFPFVLNHGRPVYDFRKFMAPAADAEDYPRVGGEPVNPSYSEAIGYQLRSARAACTAPGQGAVVYTHVLVKAAGNPTRGDYSPDALLPADAHPALAELRDAYYGAADAAAPRVLVAPTSLLLRYSAVARFLGGQARYERARNRVHVDSWHDPVLERRVPDGRYGARELRWQTFLVTDAASAEVYLDDSPLDCLQRNPATDDDGPSVTIVDVETPSVLVGAVPLGLRPEVAVQADAATVDTASAPLRCTLTAARARVRLELPACDLFAHQHVGLHCRVEGGALALRIELASPGAGWACAERAHPDHAGAWLAESPAGPGRRVLLAPVHGLAAAAGTGLPAPAARMLTAVTLDLAGTPGTVLEVRRLELYRDCDRPHRGGHLLGGRWHGPEAPRSVHARVAGVVRDGLLLDGGAFVFPRPFARGAVVEVWGTAGDGAEVAPRQGRWQEVWRDAFDLEFGPCP